MSTLREPTAFLNESKLQKVNQQSKYTVFGYVRQQTTDNLSSNVIPKLVIVVILAFYDNNIAEFDNRLSAKQHVEISNNNKTASYQVWSWGSIKCYGKRVISSLLNGIYIWKIKFLQQSTSINIGIDNSKATHCNKNIYHERDRGCYGYYIHGGYVFSWDKSGNTKGFPKLNRSKYGNTLIMKLQLDSKISKLTFKWQSNKSNDTNKEFTAFDNILRDDGLSYRLAITMMSQYMSVQLIS